MSALEEAKETLTFRDFLGDTRNWGGCHCFLTEDKKSGFMITDEKELTRVFNANPDYKLLDDPEVISIIKNNADYLVCIGYYRMESEDGKNISMKEHNICNYYHEKLGFNYFGQTTEDVTDFVNFKGLDWAVNFVQKYGLPYHVFMLNPRFETLNYTGNRDFGSFGYLRGSGETRRFIFKEKERLGEIESEPKTHVSPHIIEPKFILPRV